MDRPESDPWICWARLDRLGRPGLEDSPWMFDIRGCYCLIIVIQYFHRFIMFLGIQKIGKSKHKFKARIKFIKATNEATGKGICFKVKIQRGSHEVEAVSEPCRKGAAKFGEDQYVIPMTLFCDEEEKEPKYLEKEAILKIYQCDESGKEGRKIGSKQIDLAEYATRGKLKMEIEFDPEKRTDSPTLNMQVYLERQDDDSKSVQTYSSNNDQANEESKIRKDLGRKQKTEETDQKPQYEPAVQNKNKGKQREIGQQEPRQKEEEESQLSTKNADSRQANQRPDQRSRGKRPSSPQLQDKQYNIMITKQAKNTEISSATSSNNSKNPHVEFNQGQSPELQNFLLRKALKDKQTEIGSLKRQVEILKKSIDQIILENQATKQTQKRTGLEKQNEELKKTIVSKDIAIDKLTTQNKDLAGRQAEYEKTIMKLRQELSEKGENLSEIKYKQAYFMQLMFESQNKEALEEACRFMSV